MKKKLNTLGLISLCLSGCADTYNINPVEHQTVYIPSDKAETLLNKPKLTPQNTPTKSQAVINFIGKVTMKKTNELTSYIHRQMLAGVEEFVININSGGGDSDAGISAYQYLKQLPITISTYNTGNVQSSAALIYCSGSKRYALPYSFFMLHGSSTSYDEGMSFIEIEALSKLSKIHRHAFVEIFKTCTSDVNTTQLEKYFSSADLQYFTSNEAQNIGLVQEICAPKVSKSATFYNITD